MKFLVAKTGAKDFPAFPERGAGMVMNLSKGTISTDVSANLVRFLNANELTGKKVNIWVQMIAYNMQNTILEKQCYRLRIVSQQGVVVEKE